MAKRKTNPDFWGTAIVGERGQVVIPKEARELFDLKKGETLLVMAHHNGIVLLPKKNLERFIKQLTAKFDI